MGNWKKLFAAALVLAAPAAHAASGTGWARITFVSGGWVNADTRVMLTTPFYNPDGCSNTDGYIVPSSLPASQLLSSILLTAYSLDHHVNVIVDGCYQDRPKVIGVYMQRPSP